MNHDVIRRPVRSSENNLSPRRPLRAFQLGNFRIFVIAHTRNAPASGGATEVTRHDVARGEGFIALELIDQVSSRDCIRGQYPRMCTIFCIISP